MTYLGNKNTRLKSPQRARLQILSKILDQDPIYHSSFLKKKNNNKQKQTEGSCTVTTIGLDMLMSWNGQQ